MMSANKMVLATSLPKTSGLALTASQEKVRKVTMEATQEILTHAVTNLFNVEDFAIAKRELAHSNIKIDALQEAAGIINEFCATMKSIGWMTKHGAATDATNSMGPHIGWHNSVLRLLGPALSAHIVM